jgi:hypothetical protein
LASHYGEGLGETAEKETAGNRHLRRDGYIVPTKSIKGVSLDLSELGYREIWTVADKALDLHEYQYNDLDPDKMNYKPRSF